MKAEDVVEVVELLEGAGIASWLDGGWGVDALLREQTREHSDVDMVVELKDVPEMIRSLGERGFEMVEGEPGSNFVLRDARGRSIDVHPARFDENGDGIYKMSNGEDWIYPVAGFEGIGSVGSREVRCLTPEVQVYCHDGGYVPHESDFHDMEALEGRFGVVIPAVLKRPTE